MRAGPPPRQAAAAGGIAPGGCGYPVGVRRLAAPSRVRAALVVAMLTTAALIWFDLLAGGGGADLASLLFGGAMLAWFGNELRGAQDRTDRRLLIFGALCAALVVFSGLMEWVLSAR